MLTPEEEAEMKELKLINDTLIALRDHFEKKGRKFFLAWALFSKDPSKYKMKANFLCTTALDTDYLTVVTSWTCMAMENLNNRPGAEPYKFQL